MLKNNSAKKVFKFISLWCCLLWCMVCRNSAPRAPIFTVRSSFLRRSIVESQRFGSEQKRVPYNKWVSSCGAIQLAAKSIFPQKVRISYAPSAVGGGMCLRFYTNVLIFVKTEC